MTILFIDDPVSPTTVHVECPACKTPHTVSPPVNQTSREVCLHCNAMFTVRLFQSGMVIVE